MILFLYVQAHVNLDDPNSLEDVDQCILFYNYAVLLFHQNQYNAALTIISKVFSFIEPLGKFLSLNSCDTIKTIKIFLSFSHCRISLRHPLLYFVIASMNFFWNWEIVVRVGSHTSCMTKFRL